MQITSDCYTSTWIRSNLRIIIIYNKIKMYLWHAWRHHAVNSRWCFETSHSEFQMMLWDIMQWIPDDALRHHTVNSRWCFETSCSEFQMMLWDIMQWIPDDALRHHLVTTAGTMMILMNLKLSSSNHMVSLSMKIFIIPFYAFAMPSS